MNRLKTNYIFNLSATIINLLFPLITFPYVSRILGPEGIGKSQFIITFSQYFSMVALLGVPIYGIREIAKWNDNISEQKKIFSELVLISLITSIVTSLVYLSVVLSVTKFQNDFKYYLTAGSLVLFSFSSIDWYFSGLEKFRTIAIRNAVVKIIAILMMFGFVHEFADLFLYHIILTGGFLANNLINLFTIFKKFSFKSTLRPFLHLRPILIIFGMTLATSMYTYLDVVLLGLLTNDYSVGLYSAGVKLTKVVIPFITSIGAVLLPKMTLALHNNEKSRFHEMYKESFEIICLISIPASFYLFLYSKELILLFSGIGFIEAETCMKIMSVLPVLIGFGYLFGYQVLVPSRKDKEMLFSVIIGMIISIIGNIIIVKIFGVNGAALVNVVTELIVTGSYFYFAKKSLNIAIYKVPVFHSLLASAVFIPVFYVFNYFDTGGQLFGILLSGGLSVFLYCCIQILGFRNKLLIDTLSSINRRLKR